jgi:hypothetical protein
MTPSICRIRCPIVNGRQITLTARLSSTPPKATRMVRKRSQTRFDSNDYIGKLDVNPICEFCNYRLSIYNFLLSVHFCWPGPCYCGRFTTGSKIQPFARKPVRWCGRLVSRPLRSDCRNYRESLCHGRGWRDRSRRAKYCARTSHARGAARGLPFWRPASDRRQGMVRFARPPQQPLQSGPPIRRRAGSTTRPSSAWHTRRRPPAHIRPS